MPSTEPPSEYSPPQKATLYCFNCGHESPVDGDWIVRARDEYADYECPECNTTIVSRPTSADSVTDRERRLCCSGG